jgi:uncharacterized protein (DUF2147 family)
MKYIFTTLILGIAFFVNAQDLKSGDAILGVWKTGSGNGKVEITKKGDKYLGKIVWLSEPINPKTGKPKTDILHPDKSQHSRPVLGLINLWGFEFKGENRWEEGYIYDPKNGKQYKCNISFKDKNTLNVRGYIGIAAIGRTDLWTRSTL